MKVVLIGTYGHQEYLIRGCAKIDGTMLTAVAASEEGENIDALGEQCRRELGHDPVRYPDWRRMLDNETPDVVGVSPMFCRHAEMAAACLERGIHVVCEKPVATSLEALAKLKSAYDASPAELYGMHAMRYTPAFRAAYEAVNRGDIGRPLLISSQKSYAFSHQRPQFYKQRETFGGTIPWVAVHALDWTYWMMGAMSDIYAAHTTIGNMGYGECESSGVISFRFRGGGQGCINFDFLKARQDTVARDQVRIAGEEGTIEVRAGQAVCITHENAEEPLTPSGEDEFFEGVVAAVRGTGRCLLTSADTFEVTRLALLARQSADEKRLITPDDYPLA